MRQRLISTFLVKLGRLRQSRGAITIEYGVLIVFVALALIAAASALTTGIGDWFGRIVDFISGADPGGAASPAPTPT